MVGTIEYDPTESIENNPNVPQGDITPEKSIVKKIWKKLFEFIATFFSSILLAIILLVIFIAISLFVVFFILLSLVVIVGILTGITFVGILCLIGICLMPIVLPILNIFGFNHKYTEIVKKRIKKTKEVLDQGK